MNTGKQDRMQDLQNNEKISVITICYNAENTIEATIKSVLNQSYENIEYIIIDGGSKDKTMKIVEQYKDRINVIVSEPDNGIYDAMNKGIRMATGEWLNMMNAGDCYADSDVLSEIFSTSIPKDKTVIYSDYYAKDAVGNPIQVNIDLKSRPSFNHQCTIYRKSLHQEHGFYTVTNPIIISDILFFYMIPVSQMMKVNTVIAVFDGGGISSQGNWSLQQWLCADVVFRRRTFTNMIVTYYYRILRDSIPSILRYRLKHLFTWKKKNIS